VKKERKRENVKNITVEYGCDQHPDCCSLLIIKKYLKN
jgi:hypothetical protein